MLFFSQRRRLARIYEDWCEEEGVVDSPQAVIDFLLLHSLLCEERAAEFINEHKEKEVSNENA